MLIAVDFDGTCVTHDYPLVGEDVGAVPVLKKLVKKGHSLILLTMRSGEELEDAIEWFEKKEIDLYGVNKDPEQHEWTSSPKCYAKLYIDDCGINVPLIYDEEMSDRPFVDWNKIEEILSKNKLI